MQLEQADMNKQPETIQTEEQHNLLLREVYELIRKKPELNTPDSNRLQFLAVLIECYENMKYPIESFIREKQD